MPDPIYIVIYGLESEENYRYDQSNTRDEANEFVMSLADTDVNYIKVVAGYVLDERGI